MQLPGVRSAAVVARPDERWGEVGVAYVETVAGKEVSAVDVHQYLEPRLARFKLPREIVILGELPRNATGKILRTRLREDARQASREETTS